MKKSLTVILLTLANALFAQSLVQVYNDGRLFYPENFFEKNGIATKSDISNLKKLTLGDGLLGTTYNGTAAVSTGIDFSWLLEKRKCYQQDFRLFIDTTQSQQSLTLAARVKSVSNPFFYKDSEGNAVRTVNFLGSAMDSYPFPFEIPNIQYWTDCEIKCIDKWGNLIYFTSTIALNNLQVQMLHPEFTDNTAKVFYWEINNYNTSGGCWGERKSLTNLNSSIGASIASNSCVSGIWIYPSLDSTNGRAVPVYKAVNSLDSTNYPKKGKGDNSSAENTKAGYKWVIWGDYVREVLSNPDNTVLCWRQTTSDGEEYNYAKIWRPVRIEFFGDFKEITK